MYIYTRIVREVRGQSNLRQNYCVQDEVCFMNCQMKKKKSAKNNTNFFTLYFFFFTLHDLDLELVCELTILMCIYIYQRKAVYTTYFNACLNLFVKFVSSRELGTVTGHCWIDIILIFVAFYRRKIWRKINAGNENRTYDPWVRRRTRYHMRYGAVN